VFAPPEHCVLVLGPPRSGKTTAIVVPNVLASSGAVLSASTKPDVLDATARARRRVGRCLLYDPSGSVEPPAGVEPVGWSPLSSSGSFDEALLLARAMTGAARPGSDRGESAHWTERAGILVACLLHAAALDAAPITTVLSAVNRHEAAHALAVLDERGAEGPFDNLSGIVTTDSREQSGIWSTASSVLAAYQSSAAVASALRPPIDPRRVVEEGDTVYVVAASDHQRQAAALVAGLVHDLRRAAYQHAGQQAWVQSRGPRLVLVLDEVANIAPLEDLPQLAAEGAGQGVLTLACLQDLSQARARWGAIADGFFSLFGTKVVLPGIADTRTLQGISLLAGDHDVPRWSASRQSGRRNQRSKRTETRSVSLQREPVLPPSVVGRGRRGEALALIGTEPGRLILTPYHSCSPWREAAAPLGDPAAGAKPRPAAGLEPAKSDPWRRAGPVRRLLGR
jgi:type IV secretory pathway TraG/TraD family ATPase VirD4